MTENDDWDDESATPRPLLKVTCTDTDCENDLHCFKQTRAMAKTGDRPGTCRGCHEWFVELERTRRRDVDDQQYLLDALERELIRHHFWHLPFDQKALDHASRKGRRQLYNGVKQRLRTSVGKAVPFRDGTQTPMSGNVLYYAQHATATCCRTCINYWHGLPRGRPLTESELDYLESLITRFLDDRLPALDDEPVRVPRRPSAKVPAR